MATTQTPTVAGTGPQTPTASGGAANGGTSSGWGGTYSEPPPSEDWFPDFTDDDEVLAWLEAIPEEDADATPAVQTSAADPATEFVDVDCADLGLQEMAQVFFEQAGGPHVDLYGLDGDGNGIACEVG